MPPLAEVQAAFRRALVEGDGALAALVSDPARIAVHRNNLFASLGAVLRDTFPALCRLADERFFAYAAHEFIRRHPPRGAVLAEYGEGLGDFLAGFPPCREHPHLADLARLEWLMHRAAVAEDRAPLAASALAGVAPERTPRIVLRLHPALGLVASPWPIDALWRANRPGAPAGPVDLAAGGAYLQVSRGGGDVLMRPLDAGGFAFRDALARGATLEAAATAALAADAAFDLAPALAALFAEGAVAGFTLAEPQETPS